MSTVVSILAEIPFSLIHVILDNLSTPVHLKLGTNVQLLLQPSICSSLPSSHYSSIVFIPLPQYLRAQVLLASCT